MHLLIVVGIAAAGVCALWAVQSIALWLVNEPLTWPLRYRTRAPLVRWSSRIMVQMLWLTVLFWTPMALGIPPLEALHRALPLPIPWHNVVVAFCIVSVPACVGYALFIRAGWLRLEPRFDQATRRAKLFRRFLTPLPLAAMEEGVFRGIILEQLLQALPASFIYSALGVSLSAAIFAVVHYIRPPRRGTLWRGVYGHFIAGCLFGIGYILGGRNLWVPITLHATAIFFIQVARIYTINVGPPWLSGLPDAPQSGLPGSIAVLAMAIALSMLS